MTKIDVINKIIELSKKHKLTARQVIKGAMKYWQFNELEPEDILDLLNRKYHVNDISKTKI